MKRFAKGLLTAAWVLATGVGVQALEVGAPAPEFSGLSTEGLVHLSDFRGRNVVLAFYYADFTPV